ncbi:MAG: Na/Pi cotransporter family protein [Kiritimatiellae bacterium]|nr:Na/Pi cotransporter family protein [Kiritimatiellia bacterium]
MIFKIIGGLAIFLLGMKNMSEGMQAVAGDGLRRMINAVTNNRFKACGMGVLVTSIVQSSSVTTVMVVGFVSAGLMSLTPAIGVIMGANVGTTITAWLLVLEIGKWGLPILGIAAFFYLFSKGERLRYIGMAIMGVGMVFFGLEMMKSGLKPMRTMPQFIEWFSHFQADSYWGILKCAMMGCVLTFIVQSSSATVGITMGLASSGIIGFPTAAALVLGENVGTTITALLASIGRSTDAKRAAYSHTIFNILGVIWITTVFLLYIKLITRVVGHDPGMMVLQDGKETFPYIQGGIALVHSGFNIANTLFFLPFVPLLAKLVIKLAPEKKEEEFTHLEYLDASMIDSPVLAIQESHTQIVRMGDHVDEMMTMLKTAITSKDIDEDLTRKIFHREEILDEVQKEVTEFLGHMFAGNMTADLVENCRMQLRMADEYESISDYVAMILKLHLKSKKTAVRFTEEGWRDMLSLHDKTADYIELVNLCVKEERSEGLTKARVNGDAITFDMKEARDKHLDRLAHKQTDPLASLIFIDMLNAYRRVKDHGLNIAEAVAGEK